MEENPAEEATTEEITPPYHSTAWWVVDTYDGETFPGEIASCDTADMTDVNFMHKSGRYWKLPETVDKIFYEPNNIVHTIAPPKVVGNRGQFIFTDTI